MYYCTSFENCCYVNETRIDTWFDIENHFLKSNWRHCLCFCVLFRLAAAELFMLCWQGGRQIQLKKEKEGRGLLTPCLRLQIKDLALDHASMAPFVSLEIFFLTDIHSNLQLWWCFAVISNPSSCCLTLLITDVCCSLMTFWASSASIILSLSLPLPSLIHQLFSSFNFSLSPYNCQIV